MNGLNGTTQPNVTELEAAMLRKIARSEYTTLNGGEPTNADETSTWADCIVDSNADKGVLSSLIQKELVNHYPDGKDSTCQLSELGFKIYKALVIDNLDHCLECGAVIENGEFCSDCQRKFDRHDDMMADAAWLGHTF